MSRISVVLYNQEGNAQTGLNPATIASQVDITAVDGSASNVENEIIALRAAITALEAGGASFKGVLTSTQGLPTVGYKAGWQYVVQEAGIYAGMEAEIGEIFIAIKDYASGSANNSDWTLLQVNIVGAVTGPSTSVVNHVATFDNTTGKTIKDSGFTIAASVPANAKFTDTTYSAVNATADGLMTTALYTKLNNIEANADVTDTASVTAAGAFMKATDTSDSLTEGKNKLLMTTAERAKLGGITAGAEPNQNAFSKVVIGATTIEADTVSDTLTVLAGEGITITPNSNGDSVTISETYIDSCMVTSLSNVPKNLRNGGLIVLRG